MNPQKIAAAALALAFVISTQAQDIPERKREGYTPHAGHHKHRRPEGMDFRQLNLTEAQKTQMKTQREEFRKKMEDLKKNDNITVKEWKSRMENLRREQKAGMENILTRDQKSQLEKMKAEKKSMHELKMKQGAERMKLRLGLTDEQSARIEKSRKETGEKIRSIRENKSLSDEAKREQIRETMKKQQENMKSVLTEEQRKKMKEMHHHRGPHKDGKPAMKKEMI